MNDAIKVGLIGTGLMGLPMVERLSAMQVSVIAYNRSPEKLQSLRQAGIEVAVSAAELLQQCQVTIVMLTNSAAIEQVLLSEPTRSQLTKRTIIQMGTIAPSESRSLAQQMAIAGAEYLEAPVLGSIPEVKAGKLQVMVGASVAQFERWLPLLQYFGEPLLIGEVGAAAALKLALNQLIAALTTGFALSLAFAQRQGVGIETFMEILRQSALYAPTFDKKLQRMLTQNYAHPNFPTKHLLKDTELFLGEAIAAGLRVDSLTGIRQILEIACGTGLAEADYSALFAAIDAKNGAGLYDIRDDE